MAGTWSKIFRQLRGTGKAILIVMCLATMAPYCLASTKWKSGDQVVLLKDVTLYAEDPRSVPIGDQLGSKFDGQNGRVVSVTKNSENGGTILQLKIDGLAGSYYTYDLVEDSAPGGPDGESIGVKFILLSEWKKAQAWIGKSLWRSPDTDPYGLLPETKNLAKFVVISVSLGDGVASEPVILKVKSVAAAVGEWSGTPSSLGTHWYTSDPRKLHSSWSKGVWKHIVDGEASIGMTPAQATMAWGRPKKVNRTTGKWGVHEQWVYGTSCYLYFENGKLTASQN